MRLTNAAETDFSRLQFGGTTSAFPAIKRNGSGIDFRLADDSGYATTTAQGGIFNGNVGIGNTSPVEKLHVSNSSSGQGALIQTLSNTTGDTANLFFKISSTDLSSNYKKAAIIAERTSAGSAISNLHFALNNTTDGSSAGITDAKMSILSSGNVGVGTTTPSAKLSIEGTTDQRQFVIKQNSSQTTNPFEIQTSSGSVVASFDPSASRFFSNGGFFISSGGYAGINVSGSNLQFWQLGGGVGMVLTNGGNVGIGTTTPSQKLVVAGTIQSTDLLGGATTLETDASGNIIRTPSDENLKKNILTIDNSLEKVLQLRGVTYEFKNPTYGDGPQMGFIAQEVEEVVPEVVTSGGSYKSLKYGNLIALVVEAIKELTEIVSGFAEKFTTKELCLEDLCITKEQLQKLIDESNKTTPTTKPEPEPDQGGGSSNSYINE